MAWIMEFYAVVIWAGVIRPLWPWDWKGNPRVKAADSE